MSTVHVIMIASTFAAFALERQRQRRALIVRNLVDRYRNKASSNTSIRPGMGKRDVLELYGKPYGKRFSFLKTEAGHIMISQWIYPEQLEYVYFISGTVLMTEKINFYETRKV